MVRVLIAPDSFKGTASSELVCKKIAEGWWNKRPDDKIALLPIADGGEGTLLALKAAISDSELVTTTAQRADGKSGQTQWLRIGRDIAVIELAAICGITTINKLDAIGSHTFGLGEVIKEVRNNPEIKQILIAIGGSASTDGGTGALKALGFKFLKSDGNEITLGASELSDVATIEEPDFSSRGISVLVDVNVTLLGDRGAARNFAPQKGADERDVTALESGLAHLLAISGKRDREGYGAAGGTAFGLCALWGAQIASGIETVAELIGLERAIGESDIVITGEGALDAQSYEGKVVGYIARHTEKAGKSLLICTGVNRLKKSPIVISLTDLAGSSKKARKKVEKYLVEAGELLAAHL